MKKELTSVSFAEDGFEILNNIVTSADIESVVNEVANSELQIRRGGIRNAEKKYHSIQSLILSKRLINRVGEICA